jgi:hypothetical protein
MIIDACSFCWIVINVVFTSRVDYACHCWAAIFIEFSKSDCSMTIEAHELYSTMTPSTNTIDQRMTSCTQTRNNSIELFHCIECEIPYSMFSRKTWWPEACRTRWTSHTLWIHPHMGVVCHTSSDFDAILCLSPSSYLAHINKIVNWNEKQISVKNQILALNGEFSCGTVKAFGITHTNCTSTSAWSSMLTEFIITSSQRLYVLISLSACASLRP